MRVIGDWKKSHLIRREKERETSVAMLNKDA
jgi:hypothetical protein